MHTCRSHGILVVDDDPMVRRALIRLLQHKGHDTVAAAGGAEAFAICAAQMPALIVLDWAMPGMSGPELVHELRSRFGEAAPPVVLMSGGVEVFEALTVPGVVAVLAKPPSLDRLTAIAERFAGPPSRVSGLRGSPRAASGAR